MIDLYAAGTSNGMRARIGLEECGLAYTFHPIDLAKGEQKSPSFLAMNPNGQIPVIVDRDGPGGVARWAGRSPMASNTNRAGTSRSALRTAGRDAAGRPAVLRSTRASSAAMLSAGAPADAYASNSSPTRRAAIGMVTD